MFSYCEASWFLQTVGSRLSIRDESRYPILAEYRAIHSGSKDLEGFLNVDPGSILSCIPDMPYHAAKLIHKEGNLDSLALLAAITVQSALTLQLAVSFPPYVMFISLSRDMVQGRQNQCSFL